jgi:hypothetical protein
MSFRRYLLVLALAALPAIPSAQAQPIGLFEALLGGGARPLRQILPPPLVDPIYVPKRSRSARRAPAPRERYAGLPSPALTAPHVPKPGEILDTAGALKAVMADPTLQPGDIVVFPDGPRVFNGATDGPHRPASFERVDGSRLVGARTRDQLAALTGPGRPGAASVRLRGPAPTTPTLQAGAAAAPRVVYDGTLAVRR